MAPWRALLRGQRADAAIITEPLRGIVVGVGVQWFRVVSGVLADICTRPSSPRILLTS